MRATESRRREELCWLRSAQPAYLCRSWRGFSRSKVAASRRWLLSSWKSLRRTVQTGDRGIRRVRLRSGSGEVDRGGGVGAGIGARRLAGEPDEATTPKSEKRIMSDHRAPRSTRRTAASEAPRILQANRAHHLFCTVISNAFPRLNNRPAAFDPSPANPPFKIVTDLPLPLCGSSRHPPPALNGPGLTSHSASVNAPRTAGPRIVTYRKVDLRNTVSGTQRPTNPDRDCERLKPATSAWSKRQSAITRRGREPVACPANLVSRRGAGRAYPQHESAQGVCARCLRKRRGRPDSFRR